MERTSGGSQSLWHRAVGTRPEATRESLAIKERSLSGSYGKCQKNLGGKSSTHPASTLRRFVTGFGGSDVVRASAGPDLLPVETNSPTFVDAAESFHHHDDVQPGVCFCWPARLEEDRVSDGISFIVCCHNSARRLAPTLAHLAAQTIPPGLSWEVVV